MSEKHFKVDARAMLTWGRDSIKDHTTAVLELVKNSYDAGAKVVEVAVFAARNALEHRYIRIRDDGCGMTEDDIDNKWLRIGYSEKLAKKMTGAGRRKTGEKGVGRISADRLGATLELRTQAARQSAIGVRIDWDAIEKAGQDISDITIPLIPNPTFKIPQPSPFDEEKKTYLPAPEPIENSRTQTGTELKIYSLRHHWVTSDLIDLHRELSILTPPFGTVVDFQIRIRNDIEPELNGVVTSPFYETAEIEATFSYISGNITVPTLSCRCNETC